MSAPKIISALAGSFVIAYVCDHLMADKKIFGGKFWLFSMSSLVLLVLSNLEWHFKLGTTPKTVAEKEWWEETDKKFQAWPRTAGPPVVMNPISRQNFIVKSADNWWSSCSHTLPLSLHNNKQFFWSFKPWNVLDPDGILCFAFILYDDDEDSFGVDYNKCLLVCVYAMSFKHSDNASYYYILYTCALHRVPLLHYYVLLCT